MKTNYLFRQSDVSDYLISKYACNTFHKLTVCVLFQFLFLHFSSGDIFLFQCLYHLNATKQTELTQTRGVFLI